MNWSLLDVIWALFGSALLSLIMQMNFSCVMSLHHFSNMSTFLVKMMVSVPLIHFLTPCANFLNLFAADKLHVSLYFGFLIWHTFYLQVFKEYFETAIMFDGCSKIPAISFVLLPRFFMVSIFIDLDCTFHWCKRVKTTLAAHIKVKFSTISWRSKSHNCIENEELIPMRMDIMWLMNIWTAHSVHWH